MKSTIIAAIVTVIAAATLLTAIHRGQVAELNRELVILEQGISAHQNELDRLHEQITRIYDLVPRRNVVTSELSAGDVLDLLTARLVAEGHPVVVHRSGQ